ncbi:hypothetical protein DSAG12_03920 [Promethearchaeum syntrophicum]|uniref:Heparan-alpha-glucosaminide N-acetyltransferase catalytic domain-containing protein n=1 Tax=Promethearchaeum syntrophicum TaxID=2594042 RepID=A0A5B9DG50_9ARCH|nr:hypothetical protein [Candidatus Prometheoarchaeum syntrophicum]QEE18082.1 hypothetical protein DSAG12_03920 [Candidatus Prometheoarchaeum syntrophicum]
MDKNLTPKRFVSKDTGLGFGIVIMIIVHIFTHQLAQADPSLFIPVVSQMDLFLLITLIPLIVMGTWGTSFTMLSCMAITTKVHSMDPKDNKFFLKFILGRTIGGLLFVGLSRLYHFLFGVDSADYNLRDIGPFKINFNATTLDSIAIVSVIIPIIVFFLMKFQTTRRPAVFTGIFIFLAFGNLVASQFFIPWGRSLTTELNAQGSYGLEFIISKFVWGRFKVSQTFSFGCLGAFMGYLVSNDISTKKFRNLILYLLSFCLLIVGIASIVDWTFFLNYANIDTPTIVQVLNLGMEGLVFSWFILNLDMGSPERRVKAGKRTIWLRRFGIVSLTLYTICRWFADQVFWVLEQLMGSPLDFTGASPRLAWTTAQIYLFIGIMLCVWMILLKLWEKLHFILSIEWWINIITVLLRFKKKPNLYIKERIYGPGMLELEKKLEAEIIIFSNN